MIAAVTFNGVPVTLENLPETLASVWEQATEIWASGGWAMIAIAVIGVVMFGMGVHVLLSLRKTGFRSVSEATWRDWIDNPDQRRGPVGRMLDFVADDESLDTTERHFDQLRKTRTLPFERDLRVMKTFVSAAPLVGLLGTVTGMLSTFGALASGSGGEKTMGMIAEGISEALITTETGLVIALPGLFLQYYLTRNFDRYKAFLEQLESVCMQVAYRRQRERRAVA